MSSVVGFNTYDPEGIERGDWFAKVIVTGRRLPLLGPIVANLENRFILKAVMRGGFADKNKRPEDFLTELPRG